MPEWNDYKPSPTSEGEPEKFYGGARELGRHCDAVLVERPGRDPQWIETLPTASSEPEFAREPFKTSGGVKYDNGKLRFDLTPPDVEQAIADVFTYGAEKYGDRNWESGIAYGRLYAASRRHQTAWRRGEIHDPESGRHHLAHAIVNLIMLLHFELESTTRIDKRSLNDLHYDAA